MILLFFRVLLLLFLHPADFIDFCILAPIHLCVYLVDADIITIDHLAEILRLLLDLLIYLPLVSLGVALVITPIIWFLRGV